MAQKQEAVNGITNNTSSLFDKQCKDKYKNIKKFIDEKNKINKLFISCTIEAWKKNKNIKQATNVLILIKKFYCITPYAQRYNINKKNLIYFCNRHRKGSNKNNEKSLCYLKVTYSRIENEFYIIYDHSTECYKKNIKKDLRNKSKKQKKKYINFRILKMYY